MNSELLVNTSDYPPPPALTPAEIAAGTTELSFLYQSTTQIPNVSNGGLGDFFIGAGSTALNGSVKQVRLYNRLLPAAEIRNNAFNTCLVPQNEGSLVLWLPLNREEAPGVNLDRVNQLTTINYNTGFTTLYQPVYPTHKMPTRYVYSSLNAVTKQISPDGGQTNFWYDLLGRLVASQNAEQKESTSPNNDPWDRYSYTKYDALGRIVEVGQKNGAVSMTTAIAKTDPNDFNSAINNWLRSGTDRQITETIYDEPNTSIVTNTAITGSQNLYNTSRKRVVASIYRMNRVYPSVAEYFNATHYQYDINGNVKRLWQDNKRSSAGSTVMNIVKEMEYDYDLVSGKVNHLLYQPGKGDQFVYKYEYDADNRLVKALSGRDMNTLQVDAGYKYYLHGPLARMELGDAPTSRIVQGTDYAYTLQGWLKSVNGVNLSNAPAANGSRPNDMGNDGSNIQAAALNAQIAADAHAFTLGYYQNDYSPIGGVQATALGTQYQHPLPTSTDLTGKGLFNGNISNTTYAIAKIDNGATRGYTYGYDQLNRIREMRAHDLSSAAGTWSNSTIFTDERFKEKYTYDANGNIQNLFRNGTLQGGRSLAMDDLKYYYYYYTPSNTRNTYDPSQPLPADAWSPTNQLAHVKDAVATANYPSGSFPAEKDIDDQPNENYTYDKIGNLIKDPSEGIPQIYWTVYGKLAYIFANGKDIIIDYDANGNRIQKQVAVRATGVTTITLYIRDAQGNTIAVYSWTGTGTVPTGGTGFSWEEQHLYGSSRLGMWTPKIIVPSTLNPTTDAVSVGSKLFELTNHLGNVMVTITDKKLSHSTNGTLIDYYEPEVISSFDYTPFGMQMVGRGFNVGSYRFGFNGKENDNDVKGIGNQQDYGMRIYDPRLGRFLSTDPITDEYPELTPYQFASNTPIQAIDLDGLEGFVATGMPMGNSGHGHGIIVTPEMANRMPYPVKRIVTDFTPFIGMGLGLYEAYTGKEVHTGRQLAGWEKGLNIFPIVGPLRKTAKAINAIDDFKDVTKTINNVSDANKTIKNVTNANDVIAKIPTKVIGATGKVGENFLKTLGGVSQKYFPTTIGEGGRYIDQFVNGVAHESKVGYTTLTKDIKMQIAKDAELLGEDPRIKKVVWNFFRSPETGKVGASKPLLKALEKAGIETKIIELPK